MSKILSVYNNKGGVGKTTLNIHTALYLAGVKNKKVLLIDADSQANLTSRIYSFKHNNYTLGDLIINEEKLKLKDAILKGFIEQYPTLDLIPANREMKFLEELLVVKGKENKDLVIANWLIKNIDVLNKYDYIIWDISPSLSTVGRNVLNTCDKIIFTTEYNNTDSLEAVALFIEELNESKEKLGVSMPEYAVLINKYKNAKDSSTELYNKFQEYFENLTPYILKTKLIDSAVVRNANLYKKNIVDYTIENKLNPRAMNLFISIMYELEERGIL